MSETDTTRELLSERADAWFESAGDRHSRRAYDGRAADPAALDATERVCQEFRLLPGARVELVREPVVDVFRGIVGGYGKVTGAPHMLVMIGSDKPASQVAVGFLGEACLLEATAQGLATCWIGGFFDRSKIASLVELNEGEKAFAVSPVGLARHAYSTSERLMRGMAGAHKRKPVEALAPGISDAWPGWARSAVECARLAPSAVNRQPWRFSLAAGALVVSKDSGSEYPTVTKELDCGIALLHAHLGALAAGVDGEWEMAAGGGSEIARFTPSGTPR